MEDVHGGREGHFWKEEIKSFHLTPRLLGLQALFMEILALKKGARFADVACIYGSKLQPMKGCLQSRWAGPRLIPCLLKSHDCV